MCTFASARGAVRQTRVKRQTPKRPARGQDVANSTTGRGSRRPGRVRASSFRISGAGPNMRVVESFRPPVAMLSTVSSGRPRRSARGGAATFNASFPR